MNGDKVRVRRWALIALWLVYGADWCGGVGTHFLLGSTPANMTWAAPVFLFLATAIVFLSAPEEWRVFGISFGLGFVLEAIGVASGFPFGSYTYSDVLAPSVLGVPLVMAGAWMILIAWVRQMELPPVIGALVMAAIDLTIDPLAANPLHFWTWRVPGPYYGVPLLNFGGWFGTSLLILWLSRQKPLRNVSVFAVGLSIPLFFAFVGLAHGFLVPSSAGFAVSAFGYWRWRSSRVSTRI